MAHSSLGGMCKGRRGVGKIPARAQVILLVLNAFQMYLKAPEGQGVQSHCDKAAGSHLLLSQASKGEKIWGGMILFFFFFFFLFFPLFEASTSKAASAAGLQALGARGAGHVLLGTEEPWHQPWCLFHA